MNCARVNQVLDAWLDGELDSETSAELRRHADGCSACAAVAAERAALARTLREAMPYHGAPPGLRARILESLPVRARVPLRKPTWLQAFALAACAALLSALLTYVIARPEADDPLREQVVARHVASLAEPQRLISVESAERHTVKPWFQGRVDFSPVVKDLRDEGYVLVGGRVDYVGDRHAAAVVYRIRSHVINLFVWRTSGTAEAISAARSRGFNIATWTEDGLRYSAVSDVDPRDLDRFATLVRAR